MKKLISLLVALTCVAVQTQAGSYVAKSLFNAPNTQMLQISNSVTLTNFNGVQSTNYWYIGGPNLTNILAGTYSTTNANTGTNTWPGALGAVDAWADANQDKANITFSYTFNQTNVLQSGNENNYGVPPYTNLPTLNITPTALSTNLVTFILQKGTGPRANIQWDFVNTFTTAQTNYGIIPTSFSTNLPDAFVQGAGYIRIYSIAVGGGTGPGIILSSAYVSGYAP